MYRFDFFRNKSAHLSDVLGPEGAHQLVMVGSELIAHNETLRGAVGFAIERIFGEPDPILKTELFGKTYRSPTGLGPGILKEPHGLDLWSRFPFGFMVLGGITGKAQAGNPLPRVWRHGEDLRNFFGLPSTGIDAISAKLEELKLKKRLPNALWANLCNSASTTTDEDKAAEFAMMTEKIFPYVDVIELNFSCPNQSGVTGIQKSAELLERLIRAAQQANERTALARGETRKPILVKIGPIRSQYLGNGKESNDLTPEEIQMIVEVCDRLGVDGIVATNTAKNPPGVEKFPGKGGVSGKALMDQSRQTIRLIREKLGYTGVIIGTGGVGADKDVFSVRSSSNKLLKA